MTSGEDVPIPRATLARWAEQIAYAVDAESERQRVDALLELAADVEAALELAA